MDDTNKKAPDRLIRRREVEAITAISRSTIYAWMAEGKFPEPVKLGARAVAWRLSDISAWIDQRTEVCR